MKFYFMGICGTAMGNAALLLKEQGYEVLGADSGVYPPMSDVLQKAGIRILEGFDSERLKTVSPDRVIVGNAMSRGNPEVEWLLDQSEVAYQSLPQLFYEMILPSRFPIVVTGTHGKTTTSTTIAYLLERAGQEPGWLIGGVPLNLASGACLGRGRPFVIEGDEYDSAFFDKRSKFIHYRPKVAILNNLEFDHADIFRDLEDVQRTFRNLLRIIPSSGYALVNGDDANIAALLPAEWTNVIRVGCGGENDLTIEDFKDSPDGSSFELRWKGKSWTRVSWALHGMFNARNGSMAALAAALASGFGEDPTKFSLDALADFRGVRRRQDLLFDQDEITVLEDFAHHPTAVSGAIEALRAAYPDRKMTVCFEPRSNTAATSRFQSDFTRALSEADRVLIGAVHRAEGIPSDQRLDTDRMVGELIQLGRDAKCFHRNTELEDYFVELAKAKKEGLFVFFTNGSFDGIPKKTAGLFADGFKESSRS